MINELGEFFGWLLIITFGGTILNYCLKFINKRYGKEILKYPFLKKYMRILMNIFVKYHRYFGLATIALILLHFTIQFYSKGISITGCISGILMIIQVILGVYAYLKKKSRKGMWFFTHRLITILLIISIISHLVLK